MNRIVAAVDGVDFKVSPAECVGVVGKSGSGEEPARPRHLSSHAEPAREQTERESRVGRVDILKIERPRTSVTPEIARILNDLQDPMAHLNPTHRVSRQIAEALSPEAKAYRRMQRVLNSWMKSASQMQKMSLGDFLMSCPAVCVSVS